MPEPLLQEAVLQGKIVTWETVAEMEAGWPVIQQMYPNLPLPEYLSRLENAVKQDYRQIAYLNPHGECQGVVGLWFIPRVWCGLQADIDNFVVDRHSQSQGIGKKLLSECLRLAEERGARIAALDTFVDNPDSHRFYFREGFTIRGYHFVKPLQGQSIW